VADRREQGAAVLTALAGVTAYQDGLHGEVLAMGAESPGWAFAGVVGLLDRFAAEIDRLGGDSAALRARVYDKAHEMITA
jgi:hypothetical protein